MQPTDALKRTGDPIAAGVMVAALLVSARLGLMGAAVLWLISIGAMASIAPSAGMDPSAQSGLPGQAPAPRYRSAAA